MSTSQLNVKSLARQDKFMYHKSSKVFTQLSQTFFHHAFSKALCFKFLIESGKYHYPKSRTV